MKINRRSLKKNGYIVSTILLSVLLALLFLGMAEIMLLNWFLQDVQSAYLGISWDGWLTIRIIASPMVILLFGVLGFRYGEKYWQMIYESDTTKKS